MKEDSQTTIEDRKRLSESILWKLQNEAYCQFGPQAWSQKGVPSYVTSNPFTCREYAEVVVGYLRDCLAPDAATPIDCTQPVYILDLGAGTGRFGYLFLESLGSLLSSPELRKVKLCYVMTDIAEKNIAFWQDHPRLKPFIEAGLLDFAYYHHAETQKQISLIRSGISLSAETLINPPILIANYFFDTIPQDLFRMHQGTLEEGKVSITVDPSKVEGQLDPNNPNIIPHMSCTYSYVPVENPIHYYPDFPDISALLNTYAQQFDNIPFLFPIGAFQSLRTFLELSNGRLCLMAGDQGVCTPDQVANQGEPKVSLHGTFSISVNYHAIAQFFTNKGGTALLTPFPDPQFVIMTGVLGGTAQQFQEVSSAFHSRMDWFEPCDYWKIVNCAAKEPSSLSMEHMLLLLKLGNWDPMVFNDFYPRIRQLLVDAPKEIKIKINEIIHKMGNHVYPVGSGSGHFLMNLGVLLYELKAYSEALVYFNQALDLMGQQPQLMQNIAACLQALKKSEKELENGSQKPEFSSPNPEERPFSLLPFFSAWFESR